MAPNASQPKLELLQVISSLTNQLTEANNTISALENTVDAGVAEQDTKRKSELARVSADVNQLRREKQEAEKERDWLRGALSKEKEKVREFEHKLALSEQARSQAEASAQREAKQFNETLALSDRIHVESLAQARREAQDWKDQCTRVGSVRSVQSDQIEELLRALKGSLTSLDRLQTNDFAPQPPIASTSALSSHALNPNQIFPQPIDPPTNIPLSASSADVKVEDEYVDDNNDYYAGPTKQHLFVDNRNGIVDPEDEWTLENNISIRPFKRNTGNRISSPTNGDSDTDEMAIGSENMFQGGYYDERISTPATPLPPSLPLPRTTPGSGSAKKRKAAGQPAGSTRGRPSPSKSRR